MIGLIGVNADEIYDDLQKHMLANQTDFFMTEQFSSEEEFEAGL